MTIFLISFGVFIILLAIWVVFVRPWARTRPGWKWFFDAVEPIEIFLWRKSETILWARMLQVTGLLLTFLTMLGTIDLTPIMPLIPEAYHGTVRTVINMLPLIISVLGWIEEQLRKDTTKPLEIVELPSNAPLEAQVAAANAAHATAVAVETAGAVKT